LSTAVRVQEAVKLRTFAMACSYLRRVSSSLLAAVSVLDGFSVRLEAQAWVGKPVYSSDGKKLGEVASFERSADSKVTEMHADIGGFLGLGQHHVRLAPAQIKLQSDRIVLDVTSVQAKELPKIQR